MGRSCRQCPLAMLTDGGTPLSDPVPPTSSESYLHWAAKLVAEKPWLVESEINWPGAQCQKFPIKAEQGGFCTVAEFK